MLLKSDQLERHLAKGLGPLYVLHGDEALLSIEAADTIRSAARKAGFSEREVLQNNSRGFKWNTLLESSQNRSLFGDRKLIELRVPTGKPGREGAQALVQYAKSLGPDILTIVTLPRLEREAKNSAWFSALESAGISVEIPTIDRVALPRWIDSRLARQQQTAPAVALEFIADRVEGNLLAAHQEIQKLGLLFPTGELSLAAVQDAVVNVARYDVFKLREALLSGDGARVTRMVDGLRAEGESVVFVQWALTEEIRTLLQVCNAVRVGRPLPSALREMRVWGPRERLYEPALRRLDRGTLVRALARAADIDKIAKGLRVKASSGDAWSEIGRLVLMLTAPAPLRALL